MLQTIQTGWGNILTALFNFHKRALLLCLSCTCTAVVTILHVSHIVCVGWKTQLHVFDMFLGYLDIELRPCGYHSLWIEVLCACERAIIASKGTCYRYQTYEKSPWGHYFTCLAAPTCTCMNLYQSLWNLHIGSFFRATCPPSLDIYGTVL